MSLRVWLKKEELFDLDIEKYLSRFDVCDEDSFIGLSEEDFNEFYRKVTVARAKDLKDQSSQGRVEKKLEKLKRIWINGNGQNVSAKVELNKENNKENSSEDEKNQGGHGGNVSSQITNEALSKARGLKAWMQKEEIWQVDLFGVLVNKGIIGKDNIASEFKSLVGSRAEFDEIICKVRVLKSSELKDQKSSARLEKLLSKFEKKWEIMTDNKKTTIKKGMKVDQGEKKSDPKQDAINDMTTSGKQLKTWMQKQECWQKDLYDSLMGKGYSDPSNLCNMSEDEFDEIIRQVRVSRAEELKDSKSKSRLEKLLSKFEKEYREASGNKKTTIKKGMKVTQGGKKDKTINDEKIDEMSQGNGKELKEYMQKNKFWQKDLYDELLANNIFNCDTLSKLKVKEFDEIIRKVRVSRAKELKDSKAKERIEKVLSSFEKEWQKQSGYKKTTIKKGSKAANGDKKEKAPKDKKNEEMATKGAELKQWMRNESIWNKDLYDHLLIAGINGINELSQLNEKKMDDIIRKVRVDTVSNLKDTNARKRVDKLLTTFEKKWKATQKNQ